MKVINDYKPITVYIPKETGIYLARFHIDEKSEQIEWLDESPSGSEAWVSVEDRLPECEEGHAVEVTILSHIFDAEEPKVVASGVFYNGDFYLCAEWHGGDLELIKPLTPGRITHWQPLPQQPIK